MLVTQDDVPDESVLTISETRDDQEESIVEEVSEPHSSRSQQKRKWRMKPEASTDTQFRPSPATQFTEPSTPLEAFFLLFDEEILQHIHFQTNLKSVQNNKPAGITENEIKVFLGINIVMGYHNLPTKRSYWNTGRDLNVPIISQAMTRDRFQTILSNLHINDNTKMDRNKRDKIFKIRPLIEHLNKQFIKYGRMNEYLSVDESIIRFKGRSSLKQYNPMKPIK